jgi:predicted transport protein
MPSVLFYIADIMHNLLRVVPQIFLHTAEENCHEKQLKEVGQWCYENLSVIITDDIYLQTEKSVKKLNVSAESWPGSTC